MISLGGLGVIASVVGLLAFIAAEAFPLFRGAGAEPARRLVIDARSAPMAGSDHRLGVDESGLFFFQAGPDGRVRFWDVERGHLTADVSLPNVAPATVTASSSASGGGLLAVATSDGRVVLVRPNIGPRRAPDPAGAVAALEPHGVAVLDDDGRPVRVLSANYQGERVVVAGLVDGDVLAWWRGSDGAARTVRLGSDEGERFTSVSVGDAAEVAAGTASGRVHVWRLTHEGAKHVAAFSAGSDAVTALGWAIGGRTLLVGDAAGRLSGWFAARTTGSAGPSTWVEARRFAPHAAAVTLVSTSSRDRSFVTAAGDGSVSWRHATSGESVVVAPPQAGGPPAAALVARTAAVLIAGGDGRVSRVALDTAHPEASGATLFGKVWYEGYPGPAFVWQSTGPDAFEPKLGLVPLLFGTMKAAFYALLLAVPLAVLGALYTSQFAHPDIRARLKPAIEIIAALPSVVVGLIAGLWLATFVEEHILFVVLAMPLALASGTAGVVAWTWALPAGLRARARAGSELAVILPLVLLGAAVAFAIGPSVERAWFGGDVRQWLTDVGLTYDQRNALVVGLALGFAVIPPIFTIADDAFASVPRRLTAASAALGATPWQTAWRIVVPTASPGVLSAVMVGFGRAVGETMIVLMVSGNTPLMDWSTFNGLRSLSANIAIEAPEAQMGGTLYRVLFLSAGLLFALTFAANTVADLIRQRLRDRYEAI